MDLCTIYKCPVQHFFVRLDSLRTLFKLGWPGRISTPIMLRTEECISLSGSTEMSDRTLVRLLSTLLTSFLSLPLLYISFDSAHLLSYHSIVRQNIQNVTAKILM